MTDSRHAECTLKKTIATCISLYNRSALDWAARSLKTLIKYRIPVFCLSADSIVWYRGINAKGLSSVKRAGCAPRITAKLSVWITALYGTLAKFYADARNQWNFERTPPPSGTPLVSQPPPKPAAEIFVGVGPF